MTTLADFIHALRAEVGTIENPPGSNCNPYSHELGRPCESWCATFLAAIARRVRLTVPSYAAYTPALVGAFKAADQWHTEPAPGDYVFFDFPDNINRVQHVGVVIGVEPFAIHTVEGNTSSGEHGSQYNGGGVYERARPRNASIVGYGRPVYDHAPTPGPPRPLEDSDMPMIFSTHPDHDHGQVVETGSALFKIPTGEDAAALTAAGVKTVELSPALFDKINAKAD